MSAPCCRLHVGTTLRADDYGSSPLFAGIETPAR
jgi:hypothetical protein